MNRFIRPTLRVALAVAALAAAPAFAQTIKIGFVSSYSGLNANLGEYMERGMKLYAKLNAKELPAGVKLEYLVRDDTGANPDKAKQVTQELIVRDKVNLLAGVIFTPNAMAMAPLATEAKVPFWSCSQHRFSPGFSGMRNHPEVGKVIGCDVYGGWAVNAPEADQFTRPLHSIETMYSIMGPGVVSVTCASTPTTELITATWKDGRVGTYRGIKQGAVKYSATVFGDKGVSTAGIYGHGVPVNGDTTCAQAGWAWYYRDPPTEVSVPFEMPVLYRDENLLVVDKPHFLATTPRGGHIVQTAVVRLRREFDLPELSPAHRLDRLTAGVLVCTVRRETSSSAV